MAVKWINSNLEGGGLLTNVFWHPVDATLVLAGSAGGGLQLSTDGGDTWKTINTGFQSQADLQIASVRWHSTAKVAYILTGDGTTGGVYYYDQVANTLTQSTASGVIGCAIHPFDAGYPEVVNSDTSYPRQVGRLIVVDGTNNVIYMGSFKNGLYRSAIDATTKYPTGGWTRIALPPSITGTLGTSDRVDHSYFITVVSQDSGTGTTLYVGTHDDDGTKVSTSTVTGTDAGDGSMYKIQNAHTVTGANAATNGVKMTNSGAGLYNAADATVVSGTLLSVVNYNTHTSPILTNWGLFQLTGANAAAATAAFTRSPDFVTFAQTNNLEGNTYLYSIAGYHDTAVTPNQENIWVGTTKNPAYTSGNVIY